MAPSAPFASAKRTLAMVASVLLPVQPKKIGMRGVFIFAVSTMICFFSSGASIDVSPVEPMISTAEVPRSSWNFSKVRNAPKSTEPSLLNGVISATNEPVSIFLDITVSIPDFATLNPIDRFIAALVGRQRSDAKPAVRIYTITRRDRLRRFATTRGCLAFYPSAKLDILWPLLRREGHACVASAHCDGVGRRNDGLRSRSGAQGRSWSARSSWPERRSRSARPPFRHSHRSIELRRYELQRAMR